MKFIILMLFFLPFSLNAATYYCATPANGGNDNNPGTLAAPFATWEKLASVLVAGDIGYIRGGTYRTTKGAGATAHCRINAHSGTASNYIKLWAYPGEFPIFNLDNITATASSSIFIMILENVSYWHIKGVRLTSFIQRFSGQNTFGFYATNGTGNIFELMESDNNGYGFNFDKQINCLVKNCDGHNNQDPFSPSPYDGSDGFGSNGGQPSTVSITFKGCRSWWNSDDGWDLYRNDGIITFDSCWSFWNGYIPGTFTSAGNGDGFKVGPTDVLQTTQVRRFLSNCVSFQNKFQGYDQNNGYVATQLLNCTSYGNSGIGYHFSYQPQANLPHVMKNNVSFQDAAAVTMSSATISTNNTWNNITATTASFASLSNTGVNGPRQSNGDAPYLDFLHLSGNSNLIDRGVNVGIPYCGIAPDLGAYEYCGTAPPIPDPGANQVIIFGLRLN